MNLNLNKLKCGDYSFLFSMRMDDDGQHFNQQWPCFEWDLQNQEV